jgi:hypothetical protein
MGNGQQYTVPAAQQLRRLLKDTALQVVYDHGGASESSKIVVWYGAQYTAPFRPKQLAHLDIVIVNPALLQIVALIEIEDTTHNTKTLLGDVMTTLMGSGVAIAKQTTWQLGPRTTLLVLAHIADVGQQSTYAGRIHYLQEQVQLLLPHLQTNNARIGHIILDSFVTQAELDAKLQRYVSKVLHLG